VEFNDLESIENQLGKISDDIYQLMKELFPICRSITGNGVRQSLRIIEKHISIDIHEVSTGTEAFDWVIPKEWNIKDAYLKDSKGNKIIDFRNSNLHVLNYSVPIKRKISLSELKPHIFTLLEQPKVIPYLTSYYKENWGFCMAHEQFLQLKDGDYEICIDSTLKEGSLTYAEYFLPGKIKDEILVSCYICHPSLCNDGLSGPVIATFLAKSLTKMDHRFSYRFLFLPETIGAITWLSRNKKTLKNIKCCFVLTCGGDSGYHTYKKTLQGNAEIDRAVINVLQHSGENYKIIDFFPPGSDERQYSSPGFKIPTGLLMRTTFAEFKEYHTSADNLELVQGKYLGGTFFKHLLSFFILEHNKKYLNSNPNCEPQLGKRGLYKSIGSQKEGYVNEFALLSVLILSDGKHSLLDISERTGIEFIQIKMASDALLKNNLLTEVKD